MVIFPTCDRIAIAIIIVVVIFVCCIIVLGFLAFGIITLGIIMVVVFSTNNAMVAISPISRIIGVDIVVVIISLTCGIKGLGIPMIIFHVGSMWR
jgi:hypothetical protein